MKWMYGMVAGLGIMVACENASTNSDTGSVVGGSLTPSEKSEYLTRGSSIAKASFQALSGALQAQMKAGGPVNAVEFCNVRASPLVDSLMNEYGVAIRRTSTRFRNPVNKPTTLEHEYLARFDSIFKTGQEPRGEVVKVADQVHYFQPIFVSKACLKCHGTASDIGPETRRLLAERYPDDRATGFLAGDLRGMWSIEFEAKDASNRETNPKMY